MGRKDSTSEGKNNVYMVDVKDQRRSQSSMGGGSPGLSYNLGNAFDIFKNKPAYQKYPNMKKS